ncbi:MAG: hypothetical protein AVDCRST_MAG87-1362, partial [uncultured Thermomicrobiales bacterium]
GRRASPGQGGRRAGRVRSRLGPAQGKPLPALHDPRLRETL